MLFKDIVGQESVSQKLIDMVAEGRIAHAFLFVGAEGVGAFPMALAFAQYLNCTGDRSHGDACGKCPSCIKYNKIVHPDLHFVYPIILKNSDSQCDDVIKEWRQTVISNPYFSFNQWLNELGGEKQGLIPTNETHAIFKKLSLKTFEAKYKVMIIWLPEKMNESAANKLLKILEEPPAGTVFILVSENPFGILPTILSRTQMIKIPAIEDKDISKALTSKFGISQTEADKLAHVACGNFIKACGMVGENEEQEMYLDYFKRLMRTCYVRKVPDMIELSDDMAKLSRDALKNMLTYSVKMLRENFIMGLNDPQLNYMTPNEEAFSDKFSPFIHINNVMKMTDEFNLAIAHIEQNGNARIITMDLMLKLTVLLLTPRP